MSVLLPFRDVAPFLPDAVESVLAQEGVELELLAVDDGSTDGGAEWVRERSRREPRLSLLRGRTRGLVAALELARARARHPLLARMDGDDVSLPGRLAIQVDALLAQPAVGALGTRVEAFTDGAVTAGLQRYVAWQNGLLTTDEHHLARFVEAPLCHPSVLLRREALEAVDGYRDEPWPEDWDLWLRLADAGWGLTKVPEVLLRWRHRPGRATFTQARYGPDRLRALRATFLARELARVLGRRRLAVWGAGRTGRRLLRALRETPGRGTPGRRADRWIDIDPAKIGRTARGAPILAPTELVRGEDFVLIAVGAAGARDTVRHRLLEGGWREGEDFLAAA